MEKENNHLPFLIHPSINNLHPHIMHTALDLGGKNDYTPNFCYITARAPCLNHINKMYYSGDISLLL